jgi:hypothetical protein
MKYPALVSTAVETQLVVKVLVLCPAPAAYNASSPLAGNIGASPLPGSPVVYDRVTGEMVDCDPTLCPGALPGGEVTWEYFTASNDPPADTLTPLSRAPPLSASSFAVAGVDREVGGQGSSAGGRWCGNIAAVPDAWSCVVIHKQTACLMLIRVACHRFPHPLLPLSLSLLCMSTGRPSPPTPPWGSPSATVVP